LIAGDRAKKRVQIFHGISFRNRAVRPENMGCDYYFLVGPYMQRAFESAGLMKAGDPRAVQIGFPKTDRLLNGTLNREELLASFGFDGSRPVVVYAPTGQKRNSLEIMGKEVLKKLTKADEFDIILKTHDHPKKKVDWAGKLARFEGDHFKLAGELDVIPLLFLADLLITDASSVSSEYSLVDRPMVFLDVPELIERAKAKDSAMVDLETWGQKGGPIVSDPKGVVKAVRRGLKNPEEYAGVRRAMREDLFFNPGCSGEAAKQWIRENLLTEAIEEPADLVSTEER
jgi:CDP-glycerol glycerophosphotransferase (TagB/SpsB family)